MDEVKKLVFRPKVLVITAAILFLLGFLGWRIILGQTAGQLQFQTAKAERGTIISSVNASGNVLTANLVNITAGASGMVKKVYVQDGDKILAGQAIAEISLDQQGQKNYAQAWANYLSAKNNLDSAQVSLNTLNSQMWSAQQKFIKDAVARGLTVDDPTYIQQNADWLAAESKYKNQQAVIEQARASLNNSWLTYQSTSPTVTAPISGTISNLSLVEGIVLGSQSSSSSDQTSTSSQRVATIQNDLNPILSFNLTEIDVVRVKTGQKATVTIDSLPDKTFTGRVKTLDRIGATSGNVTSYPATIQLDTLFSEILPNMAASASIIIDTKNNVLLVLSAAVQAQGEEYFVRILKDGKEQQVPIQVGISSDTQTEIISGLSEGNEVITGTVSNISTGQRSGVSVFGGGGAFGGGAFRPGGAGSMQMRR